MWVSSVDRDSIIEHLGYGVTEKWWIEAPCPANLQLSVPEARWLEEFSLVQIELNFAKQGVWDPLMPIQRHSARPL